MGVLYQSPYELSQDLTDITGNILYKLREVIQKENPDLILVHGDTTTTLSSSLAAYYHKIKLGHVEAGLRSHNKYSPWPEEINRRIAGVIADFHFAPTEKAKENLLAEGLPNESIFVTGNTVIDALKEVIGSISNNAELKKKLDQNFSFLDPHKKLLLVTTHRRENIGEGILNVCDALLQIAARPDVQIIYPVHLNPKVKKPIFERLGNHPSIHLVAPQDYLQFVYLMMNSSLIITDSGGIQEEAPALGRPVLVVRDNTERPEGVDIGVVKLVGTDPQKIVKEVCTYLDNPSFDKQKRDNYALSLYGDGQASVRIKDIILKSLTSQKVLG